MLWFTQLLRRAGKLLFGIGNSDNLLLCLPAKHNCKLGSTLTFQLDSASQLIDKGIDELHTERFCISEIQVFRKANAVVAHFEHKITTVLFKAAFQS
jgi:hypothetical protein